MISIVDQNYIFLPIPQCFMRIQIYVSATMDLLYIMYGSDYASRMDQQGNTDIFVIDACTVLLNIRVTHVSKIVLECSVLKLGVITAKMARHGPT